MASTDSNRRIVAIAATLLGAAAVSVATAIPAAANPLDVAGSVRELNAARNQLGCPSLAANDQLNAAAAAQAAHIASTMVANSVGENKSKPEDRVRDAGYDPAIVREAVLVTPPTASGIDAVQLWTRDKTAKAAILDCRLTDVGIAVQSGPNNQSYWTLDLARRK